MKRMLLTGAILVFALGGAAGEVELPVHVSKLTLDGQIDGENIVFTLAMDAEVNRDDTILPLVVGDVAYLDGDFPRSTELVRDGNRYVLRYDRDRHERVSFTFASRAVKEGDWRRTSFEIPAASIRKLSVICDREDLEIRFPGALQVDAGQDQDGRKKVTAYLGTSRRFEVRWKPEVKRLEGDLVASCDANTIATAGVGALRLDTILTYRIIQGRLATMAIDLPDVNVTQVIGQDIQDWRIDRSDPDRPRLVIGLSRPREDTYRLKVESEMILPAFPCAFRLPVLVPRDVIRTSGFLLAGADSAIKLSAEKAGGLTQVDPAAFPTVQLEQSADRPRERPSRVTYAYQYANSPYTLDLAADDIVTSIAADARLVLSLRENELVWTAGIELDIKDAPAR